jgi:hypothetical protein
MSKNDADEAVSVITLTSSSGAYIMYSVSAETIINDAFSYSVNV